MTLMGIHESRKFNETLTDWPALRLRRAFVNPEQSLPADVMINTLRACDAVWAVNDDCIPVVSIKPDAAMLYAGLYSQALPQLADALAQRAAQGKRCLVIVHHEHEDNFTGSAWRRYFKAVYDLLKSGWSELQVGFASNSYCWRAADPRTKDPNQYNVTSDFAGIDNYSGGWTGTDVILSEHEPFMRWASIVLGQWGYEDYWIFERGFKAAEREEVIVDGKRKVLTAKPDPSLWQLRAETIKREADWLITSDLGRKCAGYIYWNTVGAENAPSLLLDLPGLPGFASDLLEHLALNLPREVSVVLAKAAVPTGTTAGQGALVYLYNALTEHVSSLPQATQLYTQAELNAAVSKALADSVKLRNDAVGLLEIAVKVLKGER